jgi:hypothetical protein
VLHEPVTVKEDVSLPINIPRRNRRTVKRAGKSNNNLNDCHLMGFPEMTFAFQCASFGFPRTLTGQYYSPPIITNGLV